MKDATVTKLCCKNMSWPLKLLLVALVCYNIYILEIIGMVAKLENKPALQWIVELDSFTLPQMGACGVVTQNFYWSPAFRICTGCLP